MQTTDYQILTSPVWQICTSSSEATTCSPAPRDRWPDRRTWLLDGSSETWQQEERALLRNFAVSELWHPRAVVTVVFYFNSCLPALWLCCFWPLLPSLLFHFCYSLRHAERMHLHCQALGRLKTWLRRAQLMCIHA